MDIYLIDEFRAAWAKRCIREARADLFSAKEVTVQELAVSLIFSALRKAQTALYYCIGEPAQIQTLIFQGMERKERDFGLNLLVEFEKLIQGRARTIDLPNRDKLLKETEEIIASIEDVVEFITKL
jgi:hypothetical protein